MTTLHRLRSAGATPVLCFFYLLLAASAAYAAAPGNAATADRVTMNDISSGEMLFRTEQAGEYAPAVNLGTDVQMQISGMVAAVTVRQQFKNDSSDWMHGVYAFPLPETAAVNGMRIEVGERVIVGQIREKQQARKEFAAAKKAGKKAALVEQKRPNLFTSSVANIPPGETITVTLTYLEKAVFDKGRFSLRFPMTITPRYIPGTPLATSDTINSISEHGWAVGTDEVPDAAEITPFLEPRLPAPGHPVNPITLAVDLNPGLPLADVSSAYHAVSVKREADRYAVKFTDAEVSMDRDFELTWTPVESQIPQAALFTEVHEGERYGLLMVVPPVQAPSQVMSRELIFVVDRSGSMSGESIRQARGAVLAALGQLQPQDSFNVIQFDDSAQALFRSARPASDPWLSQAREFVSSIESGGGTEMRKAIELALNPLSENPRDTLRQVVFITDGAVGNEAALLKLISERLGASRLFTVGIGSAPNSYFMRKAAEHGRGRFTYIGKVDEVQEKMTELFSSLQQPALKDIGLDWAGKGAESYPTPVPDLYAGQPLVVTARFANIDTRVQAAGRTAAGQWQQNFAVGSGKQSAGIAALWARDKIAHLENDIVLQGETDELRAGILQLALAHQLMSRYTSFLAVEQKPSRPTGDDPATANVRNARPNGQGPQPFAYPQTGIGVIGSMLYGLLAMAGWLVLLLYKSLRHARLRNVFRSRA